MDYKEKIESLPNCAGVYLMRDDKNEVIYVGKASNLKKRVSSYFSPSRRLTSRTAIMVSKVNDITYIPTSTEAEALIYENGLIKKLSPKYNVALKDGKSYPLLKLTVNEKFPRLFITRQRKADGAVYYGPYANAKLLKEAITILRQMFVLRRCDEMPKKVCLNYHIKQCLGPCIGKIDEERYSGIVSELKLFLDGKKSELIKLLSKKMLEESAGENFEEAERIKKIIEALSSIREETVSYNPAGELEELKNILRISHPIDVIEAFDVSNIMGEAAVGSMVYFYKGRPKKSEYRKFRIKTVAGIDDYSMMRELINRRYSRLVGEKGNLPGLIVIDGGKGHLAAALEELSGVGIKDIPAIGIAKEFEHIYLKDRNEPLIMPKESKALHLLMRIRDEAHRFAISYHKSLLSKKVEYSELDRIPGIGEKRKRALLRHFGTIDNVKNAKVENLLKVKGMNERSAKNIIDYFKK